MPGRYRTIIVEDEAPARRLLHELLAQQANLIHVSGEADNGRSAIDLINRQHPDLIFLDIHLPDMLGLDVLKQLDYKPYVIFTTAYDEYAIKAFEAMSVDYLLKPLKDDRISGALAKLQQFTGAAGSNSALNNVGSLLNGFRPNQETKTLAVKKGTKFTLVQLSDIIYLEASDKYTFVHTANGQKLFCDHMLANLEERLTVDFIRVQKSYIVNRTRVAEIHKYSNNRYSLILQDPSFTRIVTGPSYLNIVREAFAV